MAYLCQQTDVLTSGVHLEGMDYNFFESHLSKDEEKGTHIETTQGSPQTKTPKSVTGFVASKSHALLGTATGIESSTLRFTCSICTLCEKFDKLERQNPLDCVKRFFFRVLNNLNVRVLNAHWHAKSIVSIIELLHSSRSKLLIAPLGFDRSIEQSL